MNKFDAKDQKRAYFIFGLISIGYGFFEYINPPITRPTGFWSFYSRFFWDIFGPQQVFVGHILLGIAFITVGLFIKRK